MRTLRQDLLTVADAYCEAVGRARATVSTAIFSTGRKLDNIAAGRDLGTRAFERAMLWFSANWPADLAWPEGIVRPAPQAESAAPVVGGDGGSVGHDGENAAGCRDRHVNAEATALPARAGAEG